MHHPGISGYTYGTCMGNQAYFLNLMRRFKRERVSLTGLIEDLSGVVPVKVEKPAVVDLSVLKKKFKVRKL